MELFYRAKEMDKKNAGTTALRHKKVIMILVA
jgi:hypothetical protein